MPPSSAPSFPESRELSQTEKRRGQRLAFYASVPAIVFMVSMGPMTQIFFAAIHMTPMQVGLLGSIVSWMGYTQFLTSIISEHFGRKRIFTVFYAVNLTVALCTPVLPLLALWRGEAQAIFWTLWIFAFLSLFNNLGNSTWFVMLRDLTDYGTRGAFFSRLRMIWGSASTLYLFLIWLLFRGGDQNIPLWAFSLIFAIGVTGGWIRYFIVRRFPVVESVPAMGVAGTFRQALRETFASLHFRQHLVFYGLFAFVFGLVDPFLVLYIKYQLRYPDTAVNLVRLWWQIGGLLGLWLIGRFLDTVGPRIVYLWTTAVITGGMFLFVIPYAGMPYSVGLLGLIFAVKGFADFGFNLANTDSLLLVASPRNPALSIVVASAVNLTTSSIAQLISGHLLTRYAGWQPRWPIDFNIYKAMFLAAGVLFLLLVGLRFLVPAAIRKETRA